MSVLLVNMPFANLRWPNLGLSLLKSGLNSRDIPCDLLNLQFDLAEMIGFETYQWIADHFAFVLGGERLFAKDYFKDRLPSDDEFWNEIALKADPRLEETDRKDFFSVGNAVPWFIEKVFGATEWRKYDIVGFTCSFQQTLASLCLARKIKDRHPETTVVFGGAACEGVMGYELARSFPEIDHVFIGESDETFPDMARSLMDGEKRYPRVVKGDRIENLDAIPSPDFDDYFARYSKSPFREEYEPLLFFETSRGCWWGERMQCLFCGLNGNSLHYRSKSPAHVVDELSHLLDRYGVRYGCAADNIFDSRYFEQLLPVLDEKKLDFRFEYEMKANLKKSQVERFVASGLGAAQLGLETFSTPILKLLNKGATARHNLQVLKWFTETGIEVKWNFLYGFPGEDVSEYEKLCELIPKIVHFHPPIAHGKVRVDRFAPYHNDPERYGVKNLRPFAGFRYIYPFDDETLRNLAYYHDFDFADGIDRSVYAPALLAEIEKWQETYSMHSLRYFDREDGVLILSDTREIADVFQRRLIGTDRELYLYCDAARPREEIETRFPGTERKLHEWIEANIMILIDDRYYFSLALKSN